MRIRLIALALLIGAGCSGQPAGSTRVVTGQLRVSTAGLTRPVVVAESSQHRVFVANVTASGRFALTLPPGAAYRLTLASTARASHYDAVARINWPLASGAARWARLGDGDTLDLGNVYKRGTHPRSGAIGAQCSGCDDASDDHGDDDATCKEDDGASTTSHDGDYDCDCDHATTDDDHCDEDDDADVHEQECEDGDHHDGDHDDGDHDDGDHDDDDGHACDGGAPAPTPPSTPDMPPVP